MDFKGFGISQNPHLKIFAEKLIYCQSVYSDMFGLSRGVPGLSLFLHAAIPLPAAQETKSLPKE